jgi:hypothetical protein
MVIQHIYTCIYIYAYRFPPRPPNQSFPLPDSSILRFFDSSILRFSVSVSLRKLLPSLLAQNCSKLPHMVPLPTAHLQNVALPRALLMIALKCCTPSPHRHSLIYSLARLLSRCEHYRAERAPSQHHRTNRTTHVHITHVFAQIVCTLCC